MLPLYLSIYILYTILLLYINIVLFGPLRALRYAVRCHPPRTQRYALCDSLDTKRNKENCRGEDQKADSATRYPPTRSAPRYALDTTTHHHTPHSGDASRVPRPASYILYAHCQSLYYTTHTYTVKRHTYLSPRPVNILYIFSTHIAPLVPLFLTIYFFTYIYVLYTKIHFTTYVPHFFFHNAKP